MKFKNAGPDALDEVDKWVWAQLPSEDIAGGKLREKVLKYMIHKPCGAQNVNAPCMQHNSDTNRKYCNKYYPQPFRSAATINDKSGRAEYKRVKNNDNPTIRVNIDGTWRRYVKVGNEWVVPYNPILLMMFDCHICVDVVTATACVKYLFKYVNKGEDFAKARIQGILCELEQYRQTRYISAAEATWRLLGYHMVDRYPAVTKIHAHLEGEQYVTHPQSASHEERLVIAENSQSHLLQYFKRPSNDCFSNLTILDYFEQSSSPLYCLRENISFDTLIRRSSRGHNSRKATHPSHCGTCLLLLIFIAKRVQPSLPSSTLRSNFVYPRQISRSPRVGHCMS